VPSYVLALGGGLHQQPLWRPRRDAGGGRSIGRTMPSSEKVVTGQHCSRRSNIENWFPPNGANAHRQAFRHRRSAAVAQ